MSIFINKCPTQNQRELMTAWNRFAGALGKFQTVKV